MTDTKNIIVDLSFKFALNIISYTELLEKEKKYAIAKQLLRSGTSIGANIKESQNSESRIDFIHKLKIAAKEAEETEYWLQLCKCAESYPTNEILLNDIIVLKKILNKIIGTTKLK